MMSPLWIKALRELRPRLIFGVVMMVWICGVLLWVCSQFDASKPSDTLVKEAMSAGFPASETRGYMWWMMYSLAVGFTWMIMGTFLAGSGVNTQTAYGLRQGTHPSMLYTLSLPVRRRDLVLTRSLAGAALAVFISFVPGFILSTLSPLVTKQPLHLGDAMTYSAFLCLGGMAFYWLSVLFAAVLDEQWQLYATWICGSVVIVCGRLWNPPLLKTFLSFTTSELWLKTHSISWPVVAVVLTLSIAFLVTALRVVEQREY